jgi:hypothetical protein
VNRKAALLVAALIVAVTTSTAVAGTDPSLEKKKLRPADMALAKRSNLVLADLAKGWTRYRSRSSGTGSSCPGYKPNLSRFTITGEAMASFQHRQGFFIVSAIQVFPSRAEAAADFRTGAKPELARCLRFAFEGDFAKGAGGKGTTTSSRVVASPRIGERAAWYRLVGRLTVQGNVAPVHMDVLAVQKGRTQAMLMFVGLRGPIRDQIALGRLLAGRMR